MSSNSSSSSNGIKTKSRQQSIREIEESFAHKVHLQQLQDEEKILKSRIERKELKYNAAQNEIYQLLGMFFVFQGVVFTAVAQAQALTCKQWWSPFTLSLFASLATLAALLQKLAALRKFQRQLLVDKDEARILFRYIRTLKDQGSSFDLDSDPGRSRKPSRQLLLATREANIFIFFYGAALMTVVVFFSIRILVSCSKILCH
ncbi:hypothetical protein O6H91_22G022600 [Diphasiastrum complanatum]|uniref:Uncharacterized protein n=2 Tax=Diphasiastrum complanatum TaxID=34168 RepID=A0ACC2AEZ8_DIPCM|nr:hypothetical protein O6H91_22G022600 [Diphasiastrum complanatum]KAJ7515673.1 hypothetical protein O6H91_22G022600 [Diphasiastrum complanatum]